MSISDDLNNLAETIGMLSRDVETELSNFPSGAAMLDVRYKGRLFVLAFSPPSDFCVDEVEEEVVGLGTSFRHNYQAFRSAKEKLLALLVTAMKENSGLP